MHLIGVTWDLKAVDRECTNSLVVQVEAEVCAAQQLRLVSVVLIHLECHVEEVNTYVCHLGNGAHAQQRRLVRCDSKKAEVTYRSLLWHHNIFMAFMTLFSQRHSGTIRRK